MAGWEHGVNSVFLFFPGWPSDCRRAFCFINFIWKGTAHKLARTQILPVWCTAPHCSIRLIPICGSSAGRKIEHGNGAIKKNKTTQRRLCAVAEIWKLETWEGKVQPACCLVAILVYASIWFRPQLWGWVIIFDNNHSHGSHICFSKSQMCFFSCISLKLNLVC